MNKKLTRDAQARGTSDPGKTILRHALTCAVILVLPGLAAAGWDEPSAGPTACDRTADTMYRACHFDVLDDYSATIANCLNFSDGDSRRQCRHEARATWREDARACREVRAARKDACELLGEDRYDPDPLLDPAIEFIDPDDVPLDYSPNPYVNVAAGHTYVLRAGEEGEETVIVHVTGESREIQGVPCRVVVDAAVEISDDEGEIEVEAVEITDDWFAQSTAGDVYYCGEIARNFEDGTLRDLDGSFEAGIDFAKSGVLIRQFPMAGEAHRQEYALGEAEDIVQYLALNDGPTAEEGGENESFPCDDGCLRTFEFAPIEPEATEFKFYHAGTGFVLAVALEDGEVTGEREELVCVGDSLDVLNEPECELGDADTVAAVLEELCKVAPDAFCAEGAE
ncbi:hypothetical protein [Lentisalinibacter salinarum]|uniref:hypothetical protein n=1 Tax=Lentisalinibacter salinarum TaxID=2992239 RepID=UPI003863ACFB